MYLDDFINGQTVIFRHELYVRAVLAAVDDGNLPLSRTSLMCLATETVFKLVLYAWAGLACSFGPVVIFGLYWKRATKEGAIAGMFRR